MRHLLMRLSHSLSSPVGANKKGVVHLISRNPHPLQCEPFALQRALPELPVHSIQLLPQLPYVATLLRQLVLERRAQPGCTGVEGAQAGAGRPQRP